MIKSDKGTVELDGMLPMLRAEHTSIVKALIKVHKDAGMHDNEKIKKILHASVDRAFMTHEELEAEYKEAMKRFQKRVETDFLRSLFDNMD